MPDPTHTYITKYPTPNRSNPPIESPSSSSYPPLRLLSFISSYVHFHLLLSSSLSPPPPLFFPSLSSRPCPHIPHSIVANRALHCPSSASPLQPCLASTSSTTLAASASSSPVFYLTRVARLDQTQVTQEAKLESVRSRYRQFFFPQCKPKSIWTDLDPSCPSCNPNAYV